MHFPFGPFRNVGDVRLWIVASGIWIIGASVYAFYLRPPVSQSLETKGVVIEECIARIGGYTEAEKDEIWKVLIGQMQKENSVLATKEREVERCVSNVSEEATDADYKDQVMGRVAIIGVVPFAFVTILWALLGTIRWIKQGYGV